MYIYQNEKGKVIKMSYVKFYKDEIEAKRAMKFYNNSLSKKCFHKYFRVTIEGPENNYAVVDFRTAYNMQVPYSF